MGKLIFTILILLSINTNAIAENMIDPRYCGEPKRDESGKIIRSIATRNKFESMYPLPKDWKRSDWQVDHILPLAIGGCDSIVNMQWLPNKIKTCSDNSCKDRWERILYKK